MATSRSSRVSPNPWGDTRAPISVAPPARGKCACEPARSGPSAKPPTEGQPTRMRFNMAKGGAK